MMSSGSDRLTASATGITCVRMGVTRTTSAAPIPPFDRPIRRLDSATIRMNAIDDAAFGDCDTEAARSIAPGGGTGAAKTDEAGFHRRPRGRVMAWRWPLRRRWQQHRVD